MALIKGFKDPIIVTLGQMQKQFDDGISRILSQARQRRKWEIKEEGEGDGNPLQKTTACQNFGDLESLDELADAFRSRYRGLQKDFVYECTCLGMLAADKDTVKFVHKSEERNDASPVGICITGDEPNFEKGHECKWEYLTVFSKRAASIAAVSTIIDLQD